jgi:hypothetical protein
LPLGRWFAGHQLTAGEPGKSAAGPAITASGNALVYIGGAGPGGKEELAVEPAWRAMPLQPDKVFLRRLQKACPAWTGSAAPGRARLPVRVPHPRQGLLQCTGPDQPTPQVLAVVVGGQAFLGRGGDPEVAWWVKPVPCSEHDFSRLSRRHTGLEFRHGRAWLTDLSTNGTSLNGQRLVKGRPEILADDDLIELAGVLRLRVQLYASADQVHAVWLEREDTLAEQIAYLVTTGLAVVPVRWSEYAGSWLAWPMSGPGQLGFEFVSGDANAKPQGSEQVRWLPLAEPREQDRYWD